MAGSMAANVFQGEFTPQYGTHDKRYPISTTATIVSPPVSPQQYGHGGPPCPSQEKITDM